MDRRQAISKAISLAKSDDAVLITGKGTDPFIMGPMASNKNGMMRLWREELNKILK